MDGKLPIIVDEQADPEALVAQCCTNNAGLLVRVNGAWWLLRDMPGRSLQTRAFRVNVCRGCYSLLTGETEIKTTAWAWGIDQQIDEHLRQIAREMSAEQK